MLTGLGAIRGPFQFWGNPRSPRSPRHCTRPVRRSERGHWATNIGSQ